LWGATPIKNGHIIRGAGVKKIRAATKIRKKIIQKKQNGLDAHNAIGGKSKSNGKKGK
jgi:hypothetical protein